MAEKEEPGVRELRQARREAKMWEQAARESQAAVRNVLTKQNTVAPQITEAIRVLKAQAIRFKAERNEMAAKLLKREAELARLERYIERQLGEGAPDGD